MGEELVPGSPAGFDELLRRVPGRLRDLDITRTRVARTGGRGIGVVSHSDERPLPFDDRATLVTATRLLLTAVEAAGVAALEVVERELVDGARCRDCEHRSCERLRAQVLPGGSVVVVALWLRRHHTGRLAVHPRALELFDDLARADGRAARAVDRAPSRRFIGLCSATGFDGGRLWRCDADLYAPEGAVVMTCPSCRSVHDVAERRAVLLEAVRDQLASETELSQALSSLGRPLPRSTIASWVARKRLLPHGHRVVDGERTVALYRVGEVLDLLDARDARAARTG